MNNKNPPLSLVFPLWVFPGSCFGPKICVYFSGCVSISVYWLLLTSFVSVCELYAMLINLQLKNAMWVGH
jgi:hypothetical protein